jgi:hypothetical protein
MKILDVTLLAINMGPKVESMIKILDDTLQTIDGHFQFKKSMLITDKPITHSIHEIRKSRSLNSLADLNLFCIKELHRYINTPHFIIVQPDGYIIHPELWNDKWLNYDYIGAPWQDLVMRDKNNNPGIGNGGFCLRSKSLAEFVSKKYLLIPLPLVFNEDGYYSNKLNTESNLKYPSVKMALSFSQEEIIDENIVPFGIHGAPYSNAYKYWTK